MKRICAGAAWIALTLACGVSADESGPYLSAGLGRIDAPNNSNLGALTGDTRNDEWSYTAAVGYRINPNLALELGYVDLGEFHANLSDASGATNAAAHASFAANGATFALIGAFPIGQWEPYIKAGVLFSSTELQFSGTIDGARFAGRLANDNEDPMYGAGVRFTIADPLQVFLDLTYLDDVGESETGRSSYFNTTAGVLWQF